MGKIKRKIFFWLEQLQVSRKERIVIITLLTLVVVILLISSFLTTQYTSSQQRYEEILAEFNAKSAAIEQESLAEAKKYIPSESEIEQNEIEQNQEMDVEGVNEIEKLTSIVNINTATIDELVKLNGIGVAYAQRILDYRQENGSFESIDDLLKIKGIGKKRLEKIAPFIEL